MKNYNIADFMEDLTACFYPMQHNDEVAASRWTQLVGRKLKHFKPDTLRAAAEHIQTSRKSRSFPSIAEMISACEKNVPRAEVVGETWVSPDDACLKARRGEEYFETGINSPNISPMWAQAASENWHTALKAFVIENKRLPKGGEINHCKQEAQAFVESYEDCVRGGFGTAARLEALGANLMRTREELRNRLLHGEIGG